MFMIYHGAGNFLYGVVVGMAVQPVFPGNAGAGLGISLQEEAGRCLTDPSEAGLLLTCYELASDLLRACFRPVASMLPTCYLFSPDSLVFFWRHGIISLLLYNLELAGLQQLVPHLDSFQDKPV